LRRDKTGVSQEDYLKAIWEMLEEQQVPISARLAEELDVTPLRSLPPLSAWPAMGTSP
jgi:Mn-dependent DtxR family transcriptional regulator